MRCHEFEKPMAVAILPQKLHGRQNVVVLCHALPRRLRRQRLIRTPVSSSDVALQMHQRGMVDRAWHHYGNEVADGELKDARTRRGHDVGLPERLFLQKVVGVGVVHARATVFQQLLGSGDEGRLAKVSPCLEFRPLPPSVSI